jgi:lipopolysaccharide export system protein LptA
MTRILLAAAALAALVTAPLAAQQTERAPGAGPLDISADRGEVFDAEGRVVYTGDVNVIRGAARLRADRVEAFFSRSQGGGFSDLERIVATGDVFYVTPNEIARGDRGVYDLTLGQITLTGSVVLTQGCNVSTGEELVADLDGRESRLSSGGADQRVRSVFFNEDEAGSDPSDCPPPTIPGRGPAPFDG